MAIGKTHCSVLRTVVDFWYIGFARLGPLYFYAFWVENMRFFALTFLVLFALPVVSISQTTDQQTYDNLSSRFPIFAIDHPNVVQPLSDLLPVWTWGSPTRYMVGQIWNLSGNGVELVSEDGDRLLILQPDYPRLRRKGRAEAHNILLMQITDADSGISRYFFMRPYVPSRPAETADERLLLDGLTWIALYRIDRRSGMTTEDINMKNFRNFSDALTDDVRVGLGTGSKFAWSDPYRILSDGRTSVEAIPGANLRADAEAQARAENREDFNRVFKAANRYWVQQCNVIDFLRRAQPDGPIGSILISRFRNDNGACRVDTGLLSAWISIESLDRSRCDFSAQSGSCATTMVLGCRTYIGIGQELDAICPFVRFPQPVSVTFENQDGKLSITDIALLGN